MRIAVIGAGRVGGALGRALHAAGYPVTAVWSRSPEHAAELASALGAAVAAAPHEAAVAADLTIIAVTDTQIAAAAGALGEAPEGAAAVHLSGANSAALLAPLAGRGWQVGAFHPLQTFADAHSPVLPGTVFAIDAAGSLAEQLASVARALGGTPLPIPPETRAIYHAAAAMMANYTVVLAAQASALLAECGLPQAQALAALLPLLRGAVESLDRLGVPAALTGPIARGDAATVARHLDALAKAAPEALPIYRTLGAAAVPLARAIGGDAQGLDTITELLHPPPHAG